MRFFITGGSSGLGKELVLKLAKDPSNKICLTHNKTYPQDLAVFPNVVTLQADFSKPNSLTNVIDLAKGNNFDCLINNYHAGYHQKHLSKESSADVMISFANSVAPVVDITNTFATVFKKKKAGQIINILSSVTIGEPALGMGVYTAEKKYLLELSKHWAAELKKFNIHTSCISPKLLKTRFNDHLDPRLLQIMEANGEFSDMNEVVNKIVEVIDAPEQYHGKNIAV